MSKKRRSQLTDRAKTRTLVLARARNLCQARINGVCTDYAQDVHEILTRARGGSITDPDNCLALCRRCHSWLTDHPQFSDEWGFTVHAGATPEDMKHAELKRIEFVFQHGKKL
jgi:hypothetical protein